MNFSAQTLPAVEPGHAIPKGAPGEMKLPRMEGEGVKDAPGDPGYPKMVPHPIHGTVKAISAEHEAAIKAEVAALPPAAPPTVEQARDAEIETAIGRPMTDSEKAFVAELEAATRNKPSVTDDDDATDSVATAQTAGDNAAPVGAPLIADESVPTHPTEPVVVTDSYVAGIAPLPVASEEIHSPPVLPTSEPPAEIVAAVDAVDIQAAQASQQGAE